MPTRKPNLTSVLSKSNLLQRLKQQSPGERLRLLSAAYDVLDAPGRHLHPPFAAQSPG